MFGDGYVGTGEDASRGRALEKQREAMFAAGNREKQREMDITKEYRLKKSDEKFESTTNTTEMLLTQQTIGLQTKEEYGRKKREIEEGLGASAATPAAAAEPTEKKKKKKKEKAGALSFAMDEEDGD